MDLAGEFDTTTETIRRDLTALERAGVLRRVHGGAIPVERLGFEPALGELKIRARNCSTCGTDAKIFKFGHHHIRPPRVMGTRSPATRSSGSGGSSTRSTWSRTARQSRSPSSPERIS